MKNICEFETNINAFGLSHFNPTFGTFPLNENQLSSVEFVTNNVSWFVRESIWFYCTLLYCGGLCCVELKTNEFPCCQQYFVMWKVEWLWNHRPLQWFSLSLLWTLTQIKLQTVDDTFKWSRSYNINWKATFQFFICLGVVVLTVFQFFGGLLQNGSTFKMLCLVFLLIICHVSMCLFWLSNGTDWPNSKLQTSNFKPS